MHHDLMQPVPGAGDDKLILGRSSWSDQDTSIKYGWLDSRERISRGGEMPTSALRQAVRFAAEEGEPYLTREEIAGIARDMIDVLAKIPTPA